MAPIFQRSLSVSQLVQSSGIISPPRQYSSCSILCQIGPTIICVPEKEVHMITVNEPAGIIAYPLLPVQREPSPHVGPVTGGLSFTEREWPRGVAAVGRAGVESDIDFNISLYGLWYRARLWHSGHRGRGSQRRRRRTHA